MTKPTSPITMRMTPTFDRFIPLVDHVIANFKIAPMAIIAKLVPILICQPLSAGRGHSRLTAARPKAPISPSDCHWGVASDGCFGKV
jgi:hypothetical protein